MLASFRRLTKSTVGTVVTVLFLLLILASFALADVSGVLSGGLSGQPGELAEVGGETITDREMDAAMQRRLGQIRQQNPEADYSMMGGEFDQLLAAMIDERALAAFAREHGFNLSKRLVDAEIASIPAARGLAGRFTEEAYAQFLAQQRLTDDDVRQMISSGMLQQLLLAPVAANTRAPVGMARPYASMLLERRRGHVAFLPVEAFREGLNPTTAQVQQYYAANRQRYMIPEQRVLRIAPIGPEQVGDVQPTEQEIAAFYQQNQAQFAPKETRVISQAVVPDQAAAQAIAQRARGGASFVEATAPAGLSAADISIGPQTRAEFTELAGSEVAAAAFAADEGAIVGPIQSELGWHVVKIDGIEREGGQSLAAARDEIAAQLAANKRKEALTDLITRVENQLAEGASLTEAAQSAGLEIIETPLITAAGTSRTNPDYRLPEQLAPALATGFELAENDEPVVETMPDDAGYLVVAPGRIVPAAPAPLDSIRERVAEDWVTARATERAQAAAQAIAQRAGNAPLTQAAEAAPVAIPPVEDVNAQRIQLSRFQGQVPPALGLLFSLGEGKARMIAGAQGEGFYVVKVNEIIPGNALTQPALISQTQQQLQETLAQEYAMQFMAAVRSAVDVKRNAEAIAETKQRIIGGR